MNHFPTKFLRQEGQWDERRTLCPGFRSCLERKGLIPRLSPWGSKLIEGLSTVKEKQVSFLSGSQSSALAGGREVIKD